MKGFLSGRGQHVPMQLSSYLTPSVPNSTWAAGDFLLGAGMIIIQPSMGKIVIISDPPSNAYFLPRGRKLLGESLEQTALREAYEDSGYRTEFLPLYIPTNAPSPLQDWQAYPRLSSEPIYITVTSYPTSVRQQQVVRPAGKYIVFWYVGHIPENTVHELGTMMPDKQDYVSYLVSPEHAFQVLPPSEARALNYALAIYNMTLEYESTHLEAGGNES
ncbi:hypothetical protein APHAL10511_003348 [Amanita phalloides]|nr:hypothetical protein APHAL10511_003348 [Amanita phalloides]